MAKRFRLKNKNKFGNYNRFTDENGRQEYKNNIVYDHSEDWSHQKIIVRKPETVETEITVISPLEWRSPSEQEISALLPPVG